MLRIGPAAAPTCRRCRVPMAAAARGRPAARRRFRALRMRCWRAVAVWLTGRVPGLGRHEPPFDAGTGLGEDVRR